MRNGEAFARQVIEQKLQWHPWGDWYYEYPLSTALDPKTGLPSSGAPRRMDAICPSAQVFVEIKSDPNDIDVPGTYQADHNAHLLYNQRGIGGSWWGVVTDGEQCRRRRFFLGEPVSAWETVHPRHIEQFIHIPHNRQGEEWAWMSQGLRLTYKDGVRSILCRECDTVKPAHLYYRKSRNRYGRSDLCRVCDNRTRRQRYRQTKERS